MKVYFENLLLVLLRLFQHAMLATWVILLLVRMEWGYTKEKTSLFNSRVSTVSLEGALLCMLTKMISEKEDMTIA